MKEYTPGQGSYKVEEGGALTGIPTTYDVDTHFGSLTLRREDIDIKARGVDLSLLLVFHSDHLYSTVMPIVSKSDGPGGTGIPIPPSMMTLPGNQTNFYRFANGWSWNLPYLITGAKADGSTQTATAGGSSPGWNLFKYCDGSGKIFDLLPVITQEAWNDGKGFHTWTEGYEVTFSPEVTTLGGSTVTNGSGSLGYSPVTIIIPEAKQVISCWVIRSGSAAPYDFTPAMTTGYTPVIFLSDGKIQRFSVKGLLSSVSDAANKNSVTYSYVANRDALIGAASGATNRKTFSLATQADFDACSVGDLIMINDEIRVVFSKIGVSAAGSYTIAVSCNFDIEVSTGAQYTIMKGQLQMMTHTDGRAIKLYYVGSGLTSSVVVLLSSDQTYNNFNNGDQVLGVYSINAVNQLWRFQAVNSLTPGNTTSFPTQLAANPSTYYSPLQQVTYTYALSLDPRPDTDNITVVNHAGAATIYYFQAGGFCTHSWNNSFFHSGSCRRGGTSTLLTIERPDFYIGSSYNYLSINRIDQRAFYDASKADYQKDAHAADFNNDYKKATYEQQQKYDSDRNIAAHAPAVSAWQLVTKQISSNRVLLSTPLTVAPLQNDVYGCVQLQGPPDMSLRVNASSQDTTKVYIDYTNNGSGTALKAGDYIFLRGSMAQLQGVGTDTWAGASQRYVLTTDPLPFSAAEGEHVMAVYLTGGKIPNPQTHYGYYLNKPKCVRIEFKSSLAATLKRWKRIDYSYSYAIQGMEQSDTFDEGGFDQSHIEGPQPSSFTLSDIKLTSTTVTTSEASASSESALFRDIYGFAYDPKEFHKGTDSEVRHRYDAASLAWLFVKATTKIQGRPCFNAGYWGTTSEEHFEGGDATNLANGGAGPRQSISYRFDVYGRIINERTVSDSFESRRVRNRWSQYCCTSQDHLQANNWDLDPLHQFSANYFSTEYKPLMDTFHALGVVAATIEEVDAKQAQAIVLRKFDPVFFNLLVEDRIVRPTLTKYADLLSVNSPNLVGVLGATTISSPADLRWSADGSSFNSDLALLQIGEGALNAHMLTTFTYDVGSGSNNTNQLLTITKPMGNVYSLTYGTGWASSYIATDCKTLPSNLGGATQYVVNLYGYDLKGRMTSKTTVLSSDAAGTTPYAYGSSAPKTKWEYSYDGLDRLRSKTVGNGTTQTLSRQLVYVDDGDGAHEGPYSIDTDYLGFRTKTLYDTKYRVVATQRFKPSTNVAGVTTYANSLVVNGLCNQALNPPALLGQTPASPSAATFVQSFNVGSPEGMTGSSFCLTKTSAANAGSAQAFLSPFSTTNLGGFVIGRSYRLAAWVYVPAQTQQTFDSFSFGAQSYQSGSWTFTKAKPTAQSGVWQQIATTFTVPSGATGVSVSCSIDTVEQANTLLYVSDIEVQDISVASEVAISSEAKVYSEGLDLVVQSTRYSTAQKDPAQSITTQSSYDSIGRLLQVAARNTDAAYQGDSVYHTLKQIRYDDRLNGVITFDYVDDTAVDYVRTDVYQDWLGRGAIKTVTYTGLGGTGLARTTTNHYRHDGKLTQTTMPNDESYYYQYDNVGRLEKISYPDATDAVTLYDLNGNVVQTIDRRNISVSMSYNASDLEVTRTVLDGSSGPWPNRGNTVTKTVYTQFGPAQTITTENGLPVVQENIQYHFSGGTILRQQLLTESAGLPSAFAASGLAVGARYTIASVGTTTFTSIGAASNTVGTIFVATGAGTGTGTAFLTPMLQIAYGYDAVGNVISMTPTGSGPSPWTNVFNIAPQYFPSGSDTDNFNRSAVIDAGTSQNVVTVEPDFLGLLQRLKYGSSAAPSGQVSSQYDQFLRPRSFISGESTPALNITLTRDFLGNILTQNEPANAPAPAISNNYAYDGMKRLVAGEGSTEAYDEMSNLVSKDGATYTYQDPSLPQSDQMRLAKFTSGANTSLYSYDSNGNPTSVTQNAGWRFSALAYDSSNRLRQIVSSKTDNYWYNAGLRVKKTEDATGSWQTTYTLFAGNNPLLQETYNASGRVQTSFNVIVNEKILAQYKMVYPSTLSKVFFYLDHLGSRRVVLDSTAAVIDRYRYSAWGTVTQDAGTDAYASYTGKDYDGTGLIYFNARYYDPLTSRFLTEDPARKGGNWYSYCENNPVNFTDPTGMESEGLQSLFNQIGTLTKDPMTQALAGDVSSQAKLGVAFKEAGKQLAGQGADIASKVSLAATGVTMGAAVIGNAPVAASAAAVSAAADRVGLVLSVLSGDKNRVLSATLAVGLGVIPGKLNVNWNATAKRFSDPETAKFLPTALGRAALGGSAASGTVAGQVVDNAQKKKP